MGEIGDGTSGPGNHLPAVAVGTTPSNGLVHPVKPIDHLGPAAASPIDDAGNAAHQRRPPAPAHTSA
jgi:hypothetical protein